MKRSKANGVIDLDDALWERVMAATDGAVAPCFQCGVCTATCPWGLLQAEPVNVRQLMHRAQLGIQQKDGAMWWCTTCRACEVQCPRGVPIADVMLALRSLAWKDGQAPRGLASVMWALYWDANPWRRPPSQRALWAKGLDVKSFEPADEVLYYVGCTPSYDSRTQKVARALVALFREAGVAFGTLGEDEPCCGDAAYGLGQRDYVRHIVEANVELFSQRGVQTLVTTSPHCYDMFRNQYPAEASLRPLHYSQYLAALVDEGRLSFDKPFEARVTFHDPCYLSRRNDVQAEPRQVLAAIPGLEVVEMARSGEGTLCCGGGGGRMWMETKAGERFADLRVEEALDTGAEILVTACPHCIACLEDGVKLSGRDLRVMDLAELAASALQLETSPRAKPPATRSAK
ncbi:MAG: (Fe-S)-binding protein [Dehalococcoidia bacterium]|nr:(Fe-S)-binding protein [Dehalococcoidia bacterium]